jgi:hypothetical protein
METETICKYPDRDYSSVKLMFKNGARRAQTQIGSSLRLLYLNIPFRTMPPAEAHQNISSVWFASYWRQRTPSSILYSSLRLLLISVCSLREQDSPFMKYYSDGKAVIEPVEMYAAGGIRYKSYKSLESH